MNFSRLNLFYYLSYMYMVFNYYTECFFSSFLLNIFFFSANIFFLFYTMYDFLT